MHTEPEKDDGKGKEKKDKKLSRLKWYPPIPWATMRILIEEGREGVSHLASLSGVGVEMR